ncbi:MAG: tetratricopeptide repeat protein [Firmicutes bacterium]|nr:tetratricopeptide repeat protein [Bacillota bacterium]
MELKSLSALRRIFNKGQNRDSDKSLSKKAIHNSNAGTIKVAQTESKYSLYPHQIEAIQELTQSFNKDRNIKGLLVIPTGGGKTLTAVQWTLKNIINQGLKVLWIAHRHELLNQALEAIVNNSYTSNLPRRQQFRYRVISGMHDRPVNIQKDDDFIIASKDSLLFGINHLMNKWIMPNRDQIFMVVDEAHHAAAKSYRRLISKLEAENEKKFRVLGLTATPFRTSDNERALLTKVFPDGILYGVDLRTLISREILANPILIEQTTPLKLTKELTSKEIKEIEAFDSLPPEIAAAIAESSERNAFIVDHYIQNREKYGKLLVFAINIDHAIALTSLFKKRGITSEFIVSSIRDMDRGITISPDDNAARIKDFREGKIQVLVNVNILTEGTDLPSVQTVFLTRPTTSSILMTQMIGRALRGKKAGGTDKAYIVSFIDRWQDKIAWVNPERLLEEEYKGLEPKEREKREHITRLVAISKIEEFANIMDDSVNTDAIEAKPFMERIPVGLYSFDILILGSNGEWVNKLCDILVYDNLFSSYQFMVEELDSIFQEAQINDVDTLSEDKLNALSRLVQKQYFGDSPGVSDNIKDILRYYALNGVKPEYLELKDRENYDVTQLARHIWDNDLGIKAQGEYLDSMWNDEHSFWKVFFANNKKYFNNQIQLELNKLREPSLYRLEKTIPAEIIPEETDIKKLTLEQIKEVDFNYWNYLMQGVYAKSKDANGFYHSAISDYTSKNRLFFQIDHIKPLSQGGLSELENLQLITRWENAEKGGKWSEDDINKGDDKPVVGQESGESFTLPNDIVNKTPLDEIHKLIDDGLKEMALELINHELKAGSKEIEHYLIKTEILASEEYFDDALSCINEAIELFPENPNGYLDKGNVLFQLEKYDDALEEYKKCLMKDPYNELCLNNIGVIHELNENYKEALKFYDEVLEINPSNAGGYLGKGVVLSIIHPRKKEEALECLNRAIEFDPTMIGAYISKGELYCDLNRYEEALSSYQSALGIDNDDLDALYGKGYTLEQLKQYDEAIEMFKTVIEKEPEEADSYFRVAWILDKQRKYAEAVDYYQKNIELDPEDAMAYNNMGYILYKMRRYDEALQAYNKALKIDPEHSYARRNKKNLLNKMGTA